jgi:hypothetical protein
MILTRYLYPKHNVEFSLCVSLFKKDAEQAKFWAYEMYYSGYKKQTLDIIMEIYQEYYSEEQYKTKIMAFLQKKQGEWTKNNTKEAIVGTMIENIVRRQPDFEKIYKKWNIMQSEYRAQQLSPESLVEVKKILFIVLKTEAIQKYKTPLQCDHGRSSVWKLPRQVCIYPCYREPGSRISQIEDWRDLWLYLAAECPLWATRIKKFGGEADHPRREIQFVLEDYEEEFRNLYDMEPDEQPWSVLDKWLGIDCE